MPREADISRVLRRQDRQNVSSLTQVDSLLGLVAAIGQMAPSVALGLIADGVLYLGAIGPPGPFIQALTDASADALGPRFDENPEARQSILNSFEEHEAFLESRRESDQAVFDKYSASPDKSPRLPDIDDIALEDVDQFFRAVRPRTTIDLHDVTMYYGANDPIQVEHVRLRLGSISAWWPAKAQGVNVNYVRHPVPPGADPSAR